MIFFIVETLSSPATPVSVMAKTLIGVVVFLSCWRWLPLLLNVDLLPRHDASAIEQQTGGT